MVIISQIKLTHLFEIAYFSVNSGIGVGNHEVAVDDRLFSDHLTVFQIEICLHFFLKQISEPVSIFVVY